MKELIIQAVAGVNNLPEMQVVLVDFLRKRSNKVHRVGYVAGIISSEGLEKIPENTAKLEEYTVLMSQKYPNDAFFSAAYVFTTSVYERLEEFRLPKEARDEAFKGFWRGVLANGGVTDVSFTPRFRKSTGARDEHDFTIKLGLPHQFIMQSRPGRLIVRNCC